MSNNQPKVYIVGETHLIEKPEMEKPNMEYLEDNKLWNQAVEREQREYNEALSRQPFILRADDGKWREGDELREGVDFETKNVCNYPYCSCKEGVPSYCRFNSQGKKVAIPIFSTPANKEGDIQRLKISEQDRLLVSAFMGQEYPLEIDFNWLMPVVEKISKHHLLNWDGTACTDPIDTCYPITFNMPSETGGVMFRFKGFSLHESDILIKAAWQACVEFIKFHQQKGGDK